MTLERKINVIVDSDDHVEQITMALISNAVARGDISIEASLSIKNPNSSNEPFLSDDFGWIIGLSFAIPIFICLVLGIFVIGNISSTRDNLVYGFMGLVIGSIIGGMTAMGVKKRHTRKLQCQEKKGGFSMWITTHTDEQYQTTLRVLKSFGVHAKEVR